MGAFTPGGVTPFCSRPTVYRPATISQPQRQCDFKAHSDNAILKPTAAVWTRVRARSSLGADSLSGDQPEAAVDTSACPSIHPSVHPCSATPRHACIRRSTHAVRPSQNL
eukprot:358111-Chlamydomonas_euryale.AAC.2